MLSPDQATEKKKDVAPTTALAAGVPKAPAPETEKEVTKEAQAGDASESHKGTEPASTEKSADAAEPGAKPEKSYENDSKDKPIDVEIKGAAEGAPVEPEAPGKEKDAATDKAKASRRKSTGGSGGKKLNKKQSKARLLNINAQPGDHYLVKLKGFPPWPATICDESMLPGPIIASRPVTAKRADGTYRDDFADGGKRVNDRTFPVMYLYTNEFGWVPNGSLQELSPEQATAAINDKMRKDLQAAYELAAESHDLDFYKDLLQQFQEELVAKEEAKKTKKSKATAVDDMDIDAVDKATPAKKSKKRKAEDEVATPQRSDSIKKPKIKLTGSSAKAAANGALTPKTTKEQATKSSSKVKAKKAAEATVAKKPDLTPEEQQERKVKEVYYLRHKLQKGLFPKEAAPKPEEMPAMAGFLTKLENFAEMDASILRATRIHKLPKAIMRLENIPREDEFSFKSRSSGLLEKWTKILADTPASEGTAGGVNGAEGAKEICDKKTDANGTERPDVKITPVEDDPKADTGERDEPGSEENKAPAAVEASA